MHIMLKSSLICLALSGAASLAVFTSPAMAETALPSGAMNELENGAKAIDDKRYEDAIAAFSRALDSEQLDDEGQALAHHHRGIAQQRLGKYQLAIADYSYAINSKRLPNSVLARTHYNRAIAYGEMNDPTAAEADYDKCIEVAPTFAAAYHNRANLERRRGAYADAISDYSSAVMRLAPADQKLSLYGRSLAREQSADLEGAKADLEMALRLDPSYKLARDKLAELNRHQAEKTASIMPPKVLSTKAAPAKSDVIRVASAGGWETTAVRFENGTPILRPQATVEGSAPEASNRVASLPQPVAALKVPLTPVSAELKPSQEAIDEPSSRSSDKYRIQLGAFRSEDVAMGQWQSVIGKAQDSLAGHEPQVERADLGEKGVYYRLQTNGFKTVSEAKSLCSSLKAQKLDCIVVIR